MASSNCTRAPGWKIMEVLWPHGCPKIPLQSDSGKTVPKLPKHQSRPGPHLLSINRAPDSALEGAAHQPLPAHPVY